MNITKILFSLLFFASSVSFATELTVHLPQLSKQISYQQPVRLHQVLSDTRLQLQSSHIKAPYWLGSQLIEPEKNGVIELLKITVQERLNFVTQNYPELTKKVDTINAFLNQNTFSFRHFTSLDYDLIRIEPKLNPMLSGSFQLLLAARNRDIQFVGAVNNSKLHFIENGTLDDYLSQVELPDYSQQDQLYIIQPDGELFTVANGYWSQSQINLAPGAIIFSGIEDLPEGFSQLNKQIAELLRYQVPVVMESSTL